MPVNYANVEDQYKNVKDLKREDVQKLMEWIKVQPHLPPITELQTIIFLYSCHCSNEAAKITIDNYYTTRTHCPEFFANRNPTNSELQLVMKTAYMTPMPKLTPEGYVIFFAGLKDTNAENFVFNSCLKIFDMGASLYLQENGAMQGHIVVFDLEGYTLTHLLKTSILSVKKFLFFLQEALTFRLRGLHFVNAVPFMDKILALIKPFMKKEFVDIISIHYGDNETLFKMLPRDCFPNHINGTCGLINDINNEFKDKIISNADYFIAEEKLIVDESKRVEKPNNSGALFGVEGTFKKLEID